MYEYFTKIFTLTADPRQGGIIKTFQSYGLSVDEWLESFHIDSMKASQPEIVGYIPLKEDTIAITIKRFNRNK